MPRDGMDDSEHIPWLPEHAAPLPSPACHSVPNDAGEAGPRKRANDDGRGCVRVVVCVCVGWVARV